MPIVPVILCGGTGTRLWPESRAQLPKQFINVGNQENLFDLTLKRLLKIKNITKPIIITNEKYKFLVRDSLAKFNLKATLILEPIGKNTAPAIYIASQLVNESDNLLVMPSDHYINKNSRFIKDINEVFLENILSKFIVFGVTPTFPSTSYGYIETKAQNIYNHLIKVSRFVEKPNLKKAKNYFNSKNFFWNAGIFVGGAKNFSNSIRKFEPLIAKFCDLNLKKSKMLKHEDELYFNKSLFNKIPSISIDFAVMERSNDILCKTLDCGWTDIGSWDKYFEIFPRNRNNKHVIQVQSKNNNIKTSERIVATIGVNDLNIIDNKDAILITKKGLDTQMRELISILEKKNIKQLYENTFENRPWGKFENLIETEKYKIKKITVNPYGKLSKQYHNHRSEHWIIVSGKAKIFKDNDYIFLKKGDSIDIPEECIHYIENETDEDLIFIEIQMGTYFGEDDIIRLEDKYGR